MSVRDFFNKRPKQIGDKCWYCGGQLIWKVDYNYDEVHGEGQGSVTCLRCSECGAHV